MEGDLSLSQSLGGLRIANPDDSLTLEHTATEQSTSSRSNDLTAITTTDSNQTSTSRQHLPEISHDEPGRPLSQLNFDPSSYKSEDYLLSSSPAILDQSPLIGRQPSVRRSNALNGMQDQRQQYGQTYPPVYPAAPRQQSAALRQTPPTYGQSPLGSALPTADPSYRLHREPSQSSINGSSRRNVARVSGTAQQAGVPTSEGSYSDRTYRNVQHTATGNAPYPPRRSSKNIPPGYMTNGQASPMQYNHSVPASRSNSDDWQERGAAIAVRPELDASGRPVIDVNGQPVLRSHKKGVKDFQFGRTLGEGSYSTVLLAKDRQTGSEYAIKVLDKRHIIKEKKVKYVNIEKDTLNRLNDHPGVVRLYYTFQDERSLYFVLDVANGGELLGTLKRMGTFDEECTKFYGAQILDTVEYMHSRGVIHRDLKPENILLDDRMHLKITDFGTAKILEPPSRSRSSSNVVPLPGENDQASGDRAVSFVGTAEYVSPELLTDKNAGKASDLWAFGCIIYQLLAGRPPFKAANEYLTFQKIVALDYSFPKGFPFIARDLIERLLVLEPSRRLTIDHVKNHEFFHGIRWGRGLWDQKPPKLKSYTPPTLIQNLNTPGSSHARDQGPSTPSEITPSHSTRPVHISANGHGVSTPKRPSPRVITELPPPSQLDIEWSPILTRNNERIIKVGQQIVLSSSAASSPNGGKVEKANGNTFTRFFGGGGTSKKRQRLVMVTSSGRVLIAASDGNEKKTKSEVSLMQEGCSWKKQQDPKGLSYWVIDTKDRHITFEDPKFVTPDAITTSTASDEWLESLERAKDLALSQSNVNSFSDESRGFPSVMSSSVNTLDSGAQLGAESAGGRHNLTKNAPGNTAEELKGFKRFSKRQSKSGLAAVF